MCLCSPCRLVYLGPPDFRLRFDFCRSGLVTLLRRNIRLFRGYAAEVEAEIELWRKWLAPNEKGARKGESRIVTPEKSGSGALVLILLLAHEQGSYPGEDEGRTQN